MADLLKRAGNIAIQVNGNHMVNGATSDIAITSHGSDWYFVRSASPCYNLLHR